MKRSAAPRSVALEVLERVDAGAYSNLALSGTLSRGALSARDRGFVTDLVYGTLRYQGRIDLVLTPLLDRPLASVDAPARAALRMGTYQLLTGVAPHAAVGETVDACAQRLPRARGFVNAVLRRVAADPGAFGLPEGEGLTAVAARTAMPEWIAACALERFGAQAEPMLAAMNEAPPVTLRPRPGETDALLDELRAAGVPAARGEVVPEAVVVRGGGDPGALAAVRDGRATPQDQGSQAVVAVVDAQPGERVLEVAAAPGGKATALAERVGPSGLVVAADLDLGRVRRIGMAAERLQVPWCMPVVADGRRLPFRGAFDRVLVDAPCSGLGVLRRRAEARWRITRDDVHDLAGLQRSLLEAAVPLVRPGGRLVYSVCTWHPEETDAIAAWAGATLHEFDILDPPGDPWSKLGSGALLAPMTCDGMFVMVLERRAAPGSAPGVPGDR